MEKNFSITKYKSNIFRNITIDASIYRTVDDFKKYVANELNIESWQFDFINEIKEPIADNTDYSIFEYVTNDSKSENKDYRNRLKDHLVSLYEEQGNFFSKHCKENNLRIKYTNYTDFKIEIVGKIVKMKYDTSRTFFLSDGEKAENAYQLISRALQTKSEIVIQNSEREKIKEDYILKSNEEYVVNVLYRMTFIDLNTKTAEILYIDKFSTVNDAQRKLAKKIGVKEKLSPENFIFYDDYKQRITDTLIQLRYIHVDHRRTFYYKIDKSEQSAERKRKNISDSDIEEYQPFEIKAATSSRRTQSVDSTKNTSKKTKPNDEAPTMNRRSNSVRKKLKPSIIPIENNELESFDSESKPKKIKIKDYKPKVVNIKQDSPVRRRARSMPKQSTKNPDSQEQKIPIKFVFDQKDNSKPYIILRQIPIKMKIYEVQEYLINDESLNIDFEPVLKYKYKTRKFSLDKSKTIEEVLEIIKDSTVNKTIKNFIYVDPASTKKRNIIKPRLNDDDDDDDDKYSLVPSPKAKRIRKVNENKDASTIEYTYKFKYKKKLKSLLLLNDSRLKDNENQIKKAFEIDQNVNVNYYIVDIDGNEQKIQNLNQKMKYYQKNLIFIVIPKPKAKEMKPKSEKLKYLYQTNNDSEVKQIELDKDATVLTMKQKIAEIDNVKNLDNIKIIFAGKELLENLLLKPLNIGKIVLYVYIRSEEDILLLTAKALRDYE